MMTNLNLIHGSVNLPAFLPDATYGMVRAIDARDLQHCGIDALMMNSFHLMQHPGSATIRSLGGLHKMYGWSGGIFTDSGGFQAYSLIHKNPKNGTLTDRGIYFRTEGLRERYFLTPEKSIQLQIRFGSDVVISLDDCTHPEAPLDEQELSVQRTLLWAKRCKQEFEHLVEEKEYPPDCRPKLFAVIQGGQSLALRKRCAEELLAIGFDGYGFGGYPLNSQGQFLLELFIYLRELIPETFPLHALGVGHPENVLQVARKGWSLFDSALPTRDARQGRIYTFASFPSPGTGVDQDWLKTVYIGDKKYMKNSLPIDESCDCACCKQISVGFLHHLFKMDDMLYHRLATLHNLRFLTRLCELIRSERYARAI